MLSLLNRISMQKKFLFIFGTGLAGFLFYFLVNFTISQSNKALLNSIVDSHLPTVEVTTKLMRNVSVVRAAINETALSGNADGLNKAEAANKEILAQLADIRKTYSGDLKKIDDFEAHYKDGYKNVKSLIENVVAGIEQVSAVQGQFQSHSKEFLSLEAEVSSFKADLDSALNRSIQGANQGTRNVIFAGVALLLCAIPFSAIFYYIIMMINRSLQSASVQLHSISSKMMSISDAAQVASRQLSSSSSEQATAVTETVSSMEEMKSMLSQTMNNSNEALLSSDRSFKEATEVKVVIQNLRDSMTDIERSYEELEEVNHVVLQIKDKTNVINDIVFKTQLLSFNASIEAARAGQHGRGFAVVAQEVGKLAELSGGAAQEIGKLLDHSTKRVADTIDRTKEKVEVANQISEKVAEVFERLTDRAGQVRSMVDSISTAAKEQNAGIQQVGRAMTDISEAANHTSRMAQSFAELSGTLKTQSKTLAVNVENLNRLVKGDRQDETVNMSHWQKKASKPTVSKKAS